MKHLHLLNILLQRFFCYFKPEYFFQPHTNQKKTKTLKEENLSKKSESGFSDKRDFNIIFLNCLCYNNSIFNYVLVVRPGP